MCSEYLRRKGFQSYASEFSQARLSIWFPPPNLTPNLEPQDRVRPTDQTPIFRCRDDGVELAMARWWLVPCWHKGKLKDFALTTFNTRSETVATARAYRNVPRWAATTKSSCPASTKGVLDSLLNHDWWTFLQPIRAVSYAK